MSDKMLNNKKHKPYIGITGFTERDDVLRCLEFVPENSSRYFMTGVLLSSKTINGGTNRYPVRYPNYKNVKNIFVDDERCLNMIHYATDDKSTLVSQLLDAAEIGGQHCHGFQLNVVWPDISMLKEVRLKLPSHKFVIQISNSAMLKFADFDQNVVPELLPPVIDAYRKANVIDYLLIDPSGGKGKGFNSDNVIKMLTPHRGKNYLLGVAGGLTYSTLSTLHPVLAKLPCLFWDAEGGLRDSSDNMLLGNAIQYLEASFNLDALLNALDNYREDDTIY